MESRRLRSKCREDVRMPHVSKRAPVPAAVLSPLQQTTLQPVRPSKRPASAIRNSINATAWRRHARGSWLQRPFTIRWSMLTASATVCQQGHPSAHAAFNVAYGAYVTNVIVAKRYKRHAFCRHRIINGVNHRRLRIGHYNQQPE